MTVTVVLKNKAREVVQNVKQDEYRKGLYIVKTDSYAMQFIGEEIVSIRINY